MPLVLISDVYSKKPNNWNSLFKSFFLMPVPVSSTYTSSTPFFALLTTLINGSSS